jgi:hypothetical protein
MLIKCLEESQVAYQIGDINNAIYHLERAEKYRLEIESIDLEDAKIKLEVEQRVKQVCSNMIAYINSQLKKK